MPLIGRGGMPFSGHIGPLEIGIILSVIVIMGSIGYIAFHFARKNW
jgi:hypothetical protein